MYIYMYICVCVCVYVCCVTILNFGARYAIYMYKFINIYIY